MKGDAGERIFLLVQTGPEMNYARVFPVAVLAGAALITGRFYYVAIIILIAPVVMVFNTASPKDVIPR